MRTWVPVSAGTQVEPRSGAGHHAPGPETLSTMSQPERVRREILQRSDLVKPLPEVAVKVLGLLNDPKCDPIELERHLLHEPLLVARLLGLVNSPFYGLSRPVKTVREAIMVMGFRGLRSLVLTSSAAKIMDRDFRWYGHDHKGLWKHAVCVAAAARTLARIAHADGETREEAFVAGLLHDIGKMMLASYLTQPRRNPAVAPQETCEEEAALIGLDHTEAGALVAAKWGLSEAIQETLKAHHGGTPPRPFERLVAMVRLADAQAHHRGIGYLAGCAPLVVFDPEDVARLGIVEADWPGVRAELDESMRAGLESFTE